jgi:acyl-CoA reductase-like NAD-dependent aldehyde dehydrogenase
MNRPRSDLLKLINNLRDENIHAPFVNAFVQDTGFVKKEVYRREILTPTKLLEDIANSNYLKRNNLTHLSHNIPLGKIAIVLPKNSLGIPLAKAVGASHLMGNKTIVRIPRQLTNAEPFYRKILAESLQGIEFSQPNQSAKEFLIDCLKDPDIQAIVVYGDDAWIDEYYPLAKETQTKFIFEGPGNDPLIVLSDADLNLAVEGAVTCGLNNGGQSCSALERFFIHHSVSERFTHLLLKRLDQLVIGLPDNATVDIGPIASFKLVSRIQQHIKDAIAQGATLLAGGTALESTFGGWLCLEPTVLANCTPQMSIVREETFGPVFPLLSFDCTEQLLPMVEDTRYGLNASVYGTCPTLLKAYLESTHRNVFVNSTAVSPKNQAQLSVDGGFKRSGFIWEQTPHGYIRREGRRYLTQELSQALAQVQVKPHESAEPCLSCSI